MNEETTAALARVAELFPAALKSVALERSGLLPSQVLGLVDVASAALRACITSVTVETNGTVTVVDHRTPPA